MKRRSWILIGCLLVTAGAVLLILYSREGRQASNIPERSLNATEQASITTFAQNLDTPWALAKLPDDRLIASERGGTIRILGGNNTTIPVANVVEQGEGGLLGMTLHPEFSDNQLLYVYKTTANQTNQVERYRLGNGQLQDKQTILANIPASSVHNGGEIKFGPDGKLYVTAGDAGSENNAQNRSVLAGKILRLNDDGSIPADNPFGTAVWSYGHRNPQGLAWDSQGRLWSTEHGPSGSATGFDELNLLTKGGNYGWPVIQGDETRAGMISPVAQSGANETWAPGGLAYADGALYFAGLRGATLYKAKINGDTVTLTRHLAGTYGRLRAVLVDDQRLLVGTSNRDGRGSPSADDDKILSIPLQLL